jgi:hypothetical protein
VVDWLSSAIIFPELHAVIGALTVIVAYVFAPGRLGEPERPHRRVPALVIACFVAIVTLKEVFWDPANEVGQPFLWAGATDLFWYLVGIAVMLGALWVRFGLRRRGP